MRGAGTSPDSGAAEFHVVRRTTRLFWACRSGEGLRGASRATTAIEMATGRSSFALAITHCRQDFGQTGEHARKDFPPRRPMHNQASR